MSRHLSWVPCCARSLLRSLALASIATFAAISSADDGNGRIVVVEEDWELIVGDVDAETVAPQITCTLSPRGDLNGSYATFELNHASVPSFSPGGLNLHTWAGSFRTQSQNNNSAARFQSANETVRWTQVMAIWEGKLVFAIKDGHSQTWGDFGGSNMVCSASTNLTSLGSYSPEDSVRNSGVGYASNRVQSLKLKQVRRTSDAGVTAIDQTVRTVFSR